MVKHKSVVKSMALSNVHVTRDTFVLPQDVRNLSNKMAEDLWQKHEKDVVSVRMWKDENPECMFYYQEHGLLDLNEMRQDSTLFTLGI
jgi:hypothetical protein